MIKGCARLQRPRILARDAIPKLHVAEVFRILAPKPFVK